MDEGNIKVNVMYTLVMNLFLENRIMFSKFF